MCGHVAAAEAALKASPEEAVAPGAAAASASWPKVAFGDGTFLVVWQRGVGNYGFNFSAMSNARTTHYGN